MPIAPLRTMLRLAALFSGAVLAAAAEAPAKADSLVLNGSPIPLADVSVQAIRTGKVIYRDTRGARQERPLDSVAAISFESLPELDAAERAAADPSTANDPDRVINLFLRALLKADTDLEKLWINGRLSRLHDSQKRFTLAAGHFAQVAALADDPWWKARVPLSPPDQPAYAVAKEALENLQNAQRKVKSLELKSVLDQLAAKVQPVHDRLLKEYDGPPIASGSTFSGLRPEAILAADASSAPAASRPATQAPAVAKDKSAAAATSPEAPSTSDPNSAAAIDALLTKKEFAAALARIEPLVASGHAADESHLHWQYGMALQNSGRPQDAAVAFTQVAVLWPESPDAAASLINAALIMRDTWHDAASCRRLLDRAAETAAAQNQAAVVQLVRELLSK